MSAASPDIPLFVLHGGRLWLEGELSTISSPGFLSHGRELLPGSLGASPAVDCLQSLPSGVLLPVPLRRFLRPTPPSIAFWVPAGAFPVDSRRQQRNIALHHIPPLPILEYALGSQLSTFPASRSRVNQGVLRPSTRGPEVQLSPLRTRHGRPGVHGILQTSRGQAPHGWPMVHLSMVAGFPISPG